MCTTLRSAVETKTLEAEVQVLERHITNRTIPHISHFFEYHTPKICCHIAHNNEIFIILTREFSKEQCVRPEDDKRYAIETCRSILSASM